MWGRAQQSVLPVESLHIKSPLRITRWLLPRMAQNDHDRDYDRNILRMCEEKLNQWVATAERKYYDDGICFIKRSLRPSEYKVGYKGLHVPPLGQQRLENEASSLRFIRNHTNIPVPAVYCSFQEDDAYYLITEFVKGVSMIDLTDHQRAVVCKELENHRATLRTLTSNRLGGPSGLVIPPYRAFKHSETIKWNLRPSDTPEYVFCHNDLSQHNVIVDPQSLKINAIIDWEYAGFYPPKFDFPFFYRRGPSAAIGGEVDDSSDLLAFLHSHNIGIQHEL